MPIGGPCGCPEGIATCEEVIQCVDAQICASDGIHRDPASGCVGLKLSPLDDNTARFGPDGGLYVPCECGGTTPPGECSRSVDTLPDDRPLWCGRGGGAADLTAFASPAGIEYAVANNLDMIEVHAVGLADGGAAWSPADRTTDVNVYSTAGYSTRPQLMTTEEWIGTVSDPGTTANWTGRDMQADPAILSPDGGYYGYKLPQFPLMTVEQALRQVDRRLVVNLDASASTGSTTTDVQALINAVQRACAQNNTMITISPDLAAAGWVDRIRNARITPVVGVDARTDVTPAQISETGAQWVRISDRVDHDSLLQWPAAFNVLFSTNGRHVETERGLDAGVRGITSQDPVYARNEYTAPTTAWLLSRKPEMGMKDYRTDQGLTTSSRGFVHDGTGDDTARYLFASNGIQEEEGTNPDGVWARTLLLGSLYPPDNPEPVTEMTIQWQMRLDPNSGNPPVSHWDRIGVAFCCENDVDMSGLDGSRGTVGNVYGDRYVIARRGYLALMSSSTGSESGALRIVRIDGGSPGVQIARSSTSAPGYPTSTWMDFTLTVAGNTMSFSRAGAPSGTNISVTEDPATGRQYRGKYLHLAVWNLSDAFAVGFRRVRVTWPNA